MFKYKGKLSLAKPLSLFLIGFANKFLDMEKVDMVMPVPLCRQKIRQRQFNQALLLAKPLACAFATQIDNKTLVKVNSGPAQVSLSKAERLNNVKGAFRVKGRRSIKDKSILLVDDVFTTGATANECAKILKEAGASSVQVLTLARSN
ncbi:MAG: ComF family protein [Candidatus Omnitrophica bacterium]|nr:ComF family protein [Candidatus Omnitrophota bacterium]